MFTAEAHADHRTGLRRLLEYDDEVGPVADHRTDPWRPFSCQSAELNAPRAQHYNRVRIGGIVRLRHRFYRLAPRAAQDLEAPATTTLAVGKRGTEDMNVKLARAGIIACARRFLRLRSGILQLGASTVNLIPEAGRSGTARAGDHG